MQNDLCYRKSNEVKTKWGHVWAATEPEGRERERKGGRKERRGKEGAEESRGEEINTDSEGVR